MDEEVAEVDQSQIIERPRLQLIEAQGGKRAFLESRLESVVCESRSTQIGAARNRPAARFALRLVLRSLRRFQWSSSSPPFSAPAGQNSPPPSTAFPLQLPLSPRYSFMNVPFHGLEISCSSCGFYPIVKISLISTSTTLGSPITMKGRYTHCPAASIAACLSSIGPSVTFIFSTCPSFSIRALMTTVP